MAILEIEHNGYRGQQTNGQYLPPGRYTVGASLDVKQRQVPLELATYLVDNGMALVAVSDEKPAAAPSDPAGPVEITVDLGDQPGLTDSEPNFAAAREALGEMSVEDLRAEAERLGLVLPSGYVKKSDLIDLLLQQG